MSRVGRPGGRTEGSPDGRHPSKRVRREGSHPSDGVDVETLGELLGSKSVRPCTSPRRFTSSGKCENLRQGAGSAEMLRRTGEASASKYAEGPATPELVEQLRASGCSRTCLAHLRRKGAVNPRADRSRENGIRGRRLLRCRDHGSARHHTRVRKPERGKSPRQERNCAV